MTVKKFMQRVKQINNLFTVMPLPEEGADEEDRIVSFTEAELRNILKKSESSRVAGHTRKIEYPVRFRGCASSVLRKIKEHRRT